MHSSFSKTATAHRAAFDINTLQSSVVTLLRCGGIFSEYFVGNFLESWSVCWLVLWFIGCLVGSFVRVSCIHINAFQSCYKECEFLRRSGTCIYIVVELSGGCRRQCTSHGPAVYYRRRRTSHAWSQHVTRTS